MFGRLRAFLIPTMSPDVRRLRTRLAYFAIPIYYFVLMLWLVEGIALGRFIPQLGYEANFGLVSIAILASVGLFTLWLVRQSRIAFAGHLMAVAFFAFAVLQSFDLPQSTSLMSFGFYAAIMSAGAIAGGASTYLYGLAAIAAMISSWAQNPLLLADPLNQATGLPFLVSQGALFLALAALLHFLSAHIQQMVEKLRGQADSMEQLALTDPLTEVSNRRQLISRIELEFARSRRYQHPLTLMYLDLDDFKVINDRFGHLYGDQILRGIAQSMRRSMRSTDLLARIGGDEFAILLSETTITGAESVAARLRKGIADYMETAGSNFPAITFCAGVAQLGPDDNVDDLLARADQLQYMAKARGKNQTCTEGDLNKTTETDETKTTH